MKKILALLLILALLVPVMQLGVAGTEAGATQPTETEPVETEPEDVPIIEGDVQVAEPLTWEKINSIPIANESMSEDELRQIVVDYVRMQLTVTWKPSRFTTYVNHGKELMLMSESVYAGLPYVNNSCGNLYKFMEYYDEETGVLDVSLIEGELGRVIGNQCSSCAYWGWARISNSTSFTGTPNMLQKNGCIPVGDYTYDQNIDNFHTDVIRTKTICMDNGPDVMYECYAQLKPGDGLVMYTSKAGHTRMVSSAAVVVRNADGSINGRESYITYLDQVSSWKETTQSDGTPMLIQGGVDVKYTFEKMLSSGYLPFRVPELAGLDPVEKATASLTHTGAYVTPELLCSAMLETNYCISDITLTIKDNAGNQLYTVTVPMDAINLYEYGVKGVTREKLLAKYVGDGTNTVEISTRVGTGEKLLAYSGKLVSALPEESAEPSWVLPVVIVAAVVVVGSVAALIFVKARKKK